MNYSWRFPRYIFLRDGRVRVKARLRKDGKTNPFFGKVIVWHRHPLWRKNWMATLITRSGSVTTIYWKPLNEWLQESSRRPRHLPASSKAWRTVTLTRAQMLERYPRSK